jgi:DNA-binding response OmpR family regulator
LPGGMNGSQLVASARQVRPRLKVLFVTGYADTGGLRDVLDAATQIVTKPFSIEGLAAKIESMLAS